jgi:hypothetical protein
MCISGSVVRIHTLTKGQAKIGYRMWGVSSSGSALTAAHWTLPSNPWQKRTPRKSPKPGSDSSSNIGYHADKKPTRVVYRRTYCIYGKVRLWGKVVEHTGGYRAEYAEIVSLSAKAPSIHDIKAIGKAYGVPVTR